MENKVTPISDNELRGLLNSLIADECAHENETTNLTDMELNILMNMEPMMVPVNDRGTEITNRINKNFTGTFNWPWHLLLLSLLGVGMLLWYVYPEKETVPYSSVATIQKVPTSSLPALKNIQEPIPSTGNIIKRQPIPQMIAPITDSTVQQIPVEENNYPSFAEQPFLVPQPDMQTPTASSVYPIDTLFAGIKRLEVRSSYFPVFVKGYDQNMVHIMGDIHVEGTAKIVKKTKVEMVYKKEGDLLIAEVLTSQEGGMWKLSVGTILYQGSLRINIPEGTQLTVNNNSGDIEAHELKGSDYSLHSSYGNMKLSQINGNTKATTTSGNLDVNNMNGNVTLKSNYGNLSVVNVTGDLQAECTSGNIKLEHITGSVKASTEYGNGNIVDIHGQKCTLRATSGNLMVRDVEVKECLLHSDYGQITIDKLKAELTVEATSGNIHINNHQGNINAKSSYGDLKFTGVIGNIISHSSSGNIIVNKQSGNLEASSGYGDVKVADCAGNFKISVCSGSMVLKQIKVLESADLENEYGDIRVVLKEGVTPYSFDLRCTSGEIDIPDDTFMAKKERNNYIAQRGSVKIKGYAHSGNIKVE